MSAVETIRNVLLVHYATSPNPELVADTLIANARAEELHAAAAALQARAAHYPTRRIFAAGLRHGALVLTKRAMGRNDVTEEEAR